MDKYVVWSKIPPGWLTETPGEVTTMRDQAHEFPEGDVRLKNARRTPEAFQVYKARTM